MIERVLYKRDQFKVIKISQKKTGQIESHTTSLCLDENSSCGWQESSLRRVKHLSLAPQRFASVSLVFDGLGEGFHSAHI